MPFILSRRLFEAIRYYEQILTVPWCSYKRDLTAQSTADNEFQGTLRLLQYTRSKSTTADSG